MQINYVICFVSSVISLQITFSTIFWPSQPGVWKLKPQFTNPTDATVKKLQRDMGITGRGELNIPIKAKARTEFGTFINFFYLDLCWL